MPLISFVIPLFNKEKYIINTLRSIVESCSRQDGFSDYEVIIINDGSSDKSCKYVLDYIATEDKNIKLVNQENAGPSVARNRGIALASGKYISFIDADDIVLPLYIEYIIYADRHYPDGYIFTTSFKKIESTNIDNSVSDELDTTKIEIVDNFFSRWLVDKFCYTSSITINRRFILEHNITFPEGYHSGEDQYVWFELAILTSFIHLNQSGIGYMQQVEGQLSSKRPLDAEVHIKKLHELEGNTKVKKEKNTLGNLLNSEYFYLIINNLLVKNRKKAMQLAMIRLKVLMVPANLMKVLVALIAPSFYNSIRNKKDHI